MRPGRGRGPVAGLRRRAGGRRDWAGRDERPGAAAGPFAKAAGLLEDLAGVHLTAKRVERSAEASGTARAAADRSRARAIAARRLVPLPPSLLPDKLYAAIDGTGVPVTAKETAGRDGKAEDGRARTREVKLAVFFTQDKVDDGGYPVRDPDSSTTSPPSSPHTCSPISWRQKASAAARTTSASSPSWYRVLVHFWYDKPVPDRREYAAVAISASEARSRLFPLIQQVNDDHVPVRINSKGGDAVLMSAEDFDSWQETIYLLRSPANARRLMEAVARDKSGQATVVKTVEELQALAGE